MLPSENIGDAEIIRLAKPVPDEIEHVHKETNVPVEMLTAAMDREERPRIEVDDEYKLIIFRIPHHEKNSNIPYITMALGIILTSRRIITVCSEESLLWPDLLAGKGRIPGPSARMEFLCFIFMLTAHQYLAILNQIRNEANQVENAIHISMKNEMLIKMLNLEKCLVYFSTSLRSNEQIWDRLPRFTGVNMTEPEQEMLEDVKIEFRQARDLADIHSNILSGMMDAFASVISNNLNVVMKFLTSMTIILMWPTLVASIYGMNVSLPFQNSSHAFLIVMVFSCCISALNVLLFLKLKWF